MKKELKLVHPNAAQSLSKKYPYIGQVSLLWASQNLNDEEFDFWVEEIRKTFKAPVRVKK